MQGHVVLLQVKRRIGHLLIVGRTCLRSLGGSSCFERLNILVTCFFIIQCAGSHAVPVVSLIHSGLGSGPFTRR